MDVLLAAATEFETELKRLSDALSVGRETFRGERHVGLEVERAGAARLSFREKSASLSVASRTTADRVASRLRVREEGQRLESTKRFHAVRWRLIADREDFVASRDEGFVDGEGVFHAAIHVFIPVDDLGFGEERKRAGRTEDLFDAAPRFAAEVVVDRVTITHAQRPDEDA